MVKMSNHEHIDDLDVPEISSCRLINCKLESFPPVPLPLHKAVFLPWASYSKISPLRLNQNSMCRIFLPGQISSHSSSSQSECLLLQFSIFKLQFPAQPPFHMRATGAPGNLHFRQFLVCVHRDGRASRVSGQLLPPVGQLGKFCKIPAGC